MNAKTIVMLGLVASCATAYGYRWCQYRPRHGLKCTSVAVTGELYCKKHLRQGNQADATERNRRIAAQTPEPDAMPQTNEERMEWHLRQMLKCMKEAVEEARSMGRAEGETDGRAAGYAAGRAEGEAAGRAAGYAAGEAAARQRMSIP